jgi:AbrB family transcriptional regulator (stage V sporulation protein T)
MRATGIVRRIDDLGRVVIPKEIRRSLRIREGDPLEIFVTNDTVCFKKYSALREEKDFLTNTCFELQKMISAPVIVTNRDSIVAKSGCNKKIIDKDIDEKIIEIFNSRLITTIERDCNLRVEDIPISIVIPIIANGEIYGSMLIGFTNEGEIPDANLCALSRNIIKAYLES